MRGVRRRVGRNVGRENSTRRGARAPTAAGREAYRSIQPRRIKRTSPPGGASRSGTTSSLSLGAPGCAPPRGRILTPRRARAASELAARAIREPRNANSVTVCMCRENIGHFCRSMTRHVGADNSFATQKRVVAGQQCFKWAVVSHADDASHFAPSRTRLPTPARAHLFVMITGSRRAAVPPPAPSDFSAYVRVLSSFPRGGVPLVFLILLASSTRCR